MIDSLDIATVARLTGLSSRALRFYEARGLVRPLRGASGRRYYGPAELERVHQIITLKRAGLSIAQIAALSRARTVDFAGLVDAQIAAVTSAAAELAEARALLLSVKSRIERSEPIDVATFCSLIRHGEKTMSSEAEVWKAISDEYISGEAKADFAATMPLDPASTAALAFVREWFALLAPFTAVATPAMWQGSATMYQNMGAWQGKDGAPDPGFDAEVWALVNAAAQAARAAGHDIGPLPSFVKG